VSARHLKPAISRAHGRTAPESVLTDAGVVDLPLQAVAIYTNRADSNFIADATITYTDDRALPVSQPNDLAGNRC
jgi:hypothetical protein